MTPDHGVADNTSFALQCDDDAFIDEDEPLTYELSFVLEPTEDTTVKSTTFFGPCKLSENNAIEIHKAGIAQSK